TEYLIALAEEWLAPLGFTIGSPRQASDRGSHVSLRHPEGYRLSQALIDAKVIPDFREPDNIRLGIAPLYTTFSEIYEALFRLKNITKEHLYEKYSPQRAIVT
ncbi:MAG TPA: hypothetical protein VFM05_12560, partial [Candidatus Saccharimonadales bacterium]|nr:hypothetical protein [Candidatus Saccharimonadales bacterium]